ncbi:hypothetical protein MKEN_01284800 [Mycena kentingensis (nom. inval.)]|nr:hypothetical protein MKEN_01284800 [Mycena kentingensis (nom. inval.)]
MSSDWAAQRAAASEQATAAAIAAGTYAHPDQRPPLPCPDMWAGQNYDSPHRTQGVGCTVRIKDTPFVCVLWSDPVARNDGLWNYHYALASSPDQPVSYQDLEAQQYRPVLWNGVEWSQEGMHSPSELYTQSGAEDTVVGLMKDCEVYSASSPFPEAPEDMGQELTSEDLPQPFSS